MRKSDEIGVLNGFRALMVLLVVNYHIWQQGWLGQYLFIGNCTVDLDFITRSAYIFVDGMLLLSAFLLYLPIARARDTGNAVQSFSGKKFWVRRVARILPSYLTAVFLLFIAAVVRGDCYASFWEVAGDLLSHLTFTFMFFPRTYLQTPLDGALWTIAVEVAFYLLFPLLAKWIRCKPRLTLSAMFLCGLVYRIGTILWGYNLPMLINQFPAFLDVFALGIAGAMLFSYTERKLESKSPLLPLRLFFTCVLVLSVLGIGALLRYQSKASAAGYTALNRSQLMVRLPFSLLILAAMISSAFAPKSVQWIFSNRLLRGIAVISMNLYIWHQPLAVAIREAWFDTEALHASSPQQSAYTLLCYSVAFCVAALITFAIERPCADRIRRLSSAV